MPKAAKSQSTPRTSPVKSERADDDTLVPDQKPGSESPKGKGNSSAKAWTAEETWALYQMIHPKPAEVSWKELCKQFPGKDEQVSPRPARYVCLPCSFLSVNIFAKFKSCRNRY